MGRKRFIYGLLIIILNLFFICTFSVMVTADSQSPENNVSTLSAIAKKNTEGTNLSVDIFIPKSDTVSEVFVPIWHDDNQDDIYWYPAKKISEGYYHIDFEHWRHKFHEGTYHIHVYEYMQNNEFRAISLENVEIKKESPVVNISIQNINDEKGEAEIRLDIQTSQAIQDVYVPTWCSDDQSDINGIKQKN